MKSVCVYTLGCRLNQTESEAIADSFSREGFAVVSEEERAELYIVNTCTVTSKAEQKARRMIRLFALKAEAILVTGCYAQMAQKELEELSDRIVVVPLEKKASLLRLPAIVRSDLENNIPLLDSLRGFTSSENGGVFDYQASTFSYHSRSYLKIQDGCDNECAYCRVHVARGKSRFLESDEVIRRALELERFGFHEIVLTGVNLTMYDHENLGLGGLLEKLLPRLSDETRIRLSSVEADNVDQRFLDAVSSFKMHPYFHIPIQSGSDKVLRRVERKCLTDQIEFVINGLRSAKDDPFIACDIITGLPGEGEEEFGETVDFLKRNRLAHLHVFPFSPRPDTPLERARDRVAERVRDERAIVLRKLSEELHEEYVSRQIGKRLEVLLETRRSGSWFGTTGNYLKVNIQNAPAVSNKGMLLSGILCERGVIRADEVQG